jgi:hypothetical protein
VFLWQVLGWSSLAGVLVMLLTIPANAFLAGRVKGLQSRMMKHKDKRIKDTNEVGDQKFLLIVDYGSVLGS